MFCTVVNDLLGSSQIYEASSDTTVKALTSANAVIDDLYVVCNGRIQHPEDTVRDGQVYHLVPRLVGGKGGFGSMLRAIGAQIEKTTNHEACRDLSGRRMRDVNNEKKLKEWVGKAADREREKLERKRERMERRKAVPKHMFHDPKYHEQKEKVLENQDDAIRAGLQRSTTSSGTTTKRKATATSTSTAGKKSKAEWMGVDIDPDDLSDSDDDSSTGDDEAQPSCSGSADLVTHGARQENEAGGSSNSAGGSSSGASSSSSDNSPGRAPSDEADDKTEESATLNRQDEQPMETNADSTNSDEKKKNAEKSQPESGGAKGLLATLGESPPKQQQQAEQKTEQIVQEVDLDAYSSAEDLEAVGLESLKMALVSRRLKCGGTLHERAARLYSVKGLTPDQIDPALKSKGGKVKKSKAN